MNKLLILAAFIVPLAISILNYPHGAVGILICLPLAVALILFLNKNEEDSDFIIQIFIAAFLLRILTASFIFSFDLQSFFGEDSLTHEFHGFIQNEIWQGREHEYAYLLEDWHKPWGLYYLIGAIYVAVGRNPLAIQFISCFCGAATAVLAYLFTHRIFNNYRAAKLTALMAAFFPAMIIWSSQLMKDGFIVFFVVLTIYFLIRLQEKFSWLGLLFLLASLFGIFSIRFYIFYFAAFACVGSFVFGSEKLLANNIRWLVIMIILLVLMSYAGVLSVGTEQIEKLTNLDTMQNSRMALANEASSGFSRDTDITTPLGALAAFPIGLLYLMLAPFPWQFSSLRASLPLPEMFIWWALIPMLIVGFKYTLQHRFRKSISVLLFSITLTIAYSLFQTNVGTAYRQRTQIQIFLYMFIAVGWTVWQERKENNLILRQGIRQKNLQIVKQRNA